MGSRGARDEEGGVIWHLVRHAGRDSSAYIGQHTSYNVLRHVGASRNIFHGCLPGNNVFILVQIRSLRNRNDGLVFPASESGTRRDLPQHLNSRSVHELRKD